MAVTMVPRSRGQGNAPEIDSLRSAVDKGCLTQFLRDTGQRRQKKHHVERDVLPADNDNHRIKASLGSLSQGCASIPRPMASRPVFSMPK